MTTAFWPTNTDDIWIGLTVVIVVVLVLEVLLRPKLASISVDIMEHADLSVLKDTARSCWTNMGVTAALLLTVDVAMLQTDPIQPRFPVDSDTQERLVHVQLIYDLLSGVALIYCIWALLMCVVFLCYVETGDNIGAIKFFIANPASIGGPALCIILASLHTCIALIAWVIGTSGLYNGVTLGVLFIVVLSVMAAEIYDKAAFDPSGTTPKSLEWQWPMKDQSEWPWFVQRYKKDEKACRIFKRMGQAIIDAEAEKEALATGSFKAVHM